MALGVAQTVANNLAEPVVFENQNLNAGNVSQASQDRSVCDESAS